MEEEKQDSGKKKTDSEPNSEGKTPLERTAEEDFEFPKWFTEDQKERLKAEMKLPIPDWMRRLNAAPLFSGHDGGAATHGAENNGPDDSVDSKDRTLTTTGGPDRNKLIWTGTMRALADWILQARRDGKLKATSERNALDQAAAHFLVQEENGNLRELSGKSLQQNLSNRRSIEGK